MYLYFKNVRGKYERKNKGKWQICLLFPCKTFKMSHYNECVTTKKKQLWAYINVIYTLLVNPYTLHRLDCGNLTHDISQMTNT